jgi:mannose/fructose/N-acetylgalactosamine-specific phosphotransferase system component IID
MYLVVIAWLYVVLMMSVAEATNTNGSLLGAIVTFFLYGLLPLSLVVYLMLTPHRRKGLREREAANEAQQQQAASDLPDASSHATGATEPDGVPAVGKEP